LGEELTGLYNSVTIFKLYEVNEYNNRIGPNHFIFLSIVQKSWHKILLFFAVVIVIGHGVLPHLHHDEISTIIQHHHNDHHDDHHNIFSFAQLDENFVPSQFSKVNIDLPILYLVTPVITYQIDQLKEQSKNHFGHYREFPPPGNHLSNLFSRPPPAC
jgi:hypothetical protein